MGRLVAKKPCSFGGRKFYIGEEVPGSLVADPARQENLGVLAAVPDSGEDQAGTACPRTYTQEQVDAMLAGAVADALAGKEAEYAALAWKKMQADAARLAEAASVQYDGGLESIIIEVGAEGEDGRRTAVQASPEEIQQAFAIMQMNAEEGARTVSGVESENVLILLHAADSRKTVRNAAKEQADKLFSAKDISDAPRGGCEAADTITEGAGA